ncbi:hypothetical protein [Taibaiella koreensis]|uniref:hypothetical protein n=1 Tax=Taibaiella koreensis TaxID=1268548 RepID=UPI000E59C76F|nr:hypothetical protein [Taibaiella koreensis]
MNHLIILIGLATLHFLTGYGILNLFTIKLKLLPRIALAIITGILVASMVPFLLQLFYIPITISTVFGTLGMLTCLLNIKTAIGLRKVRPRLTFRPRLKLYELPAILLIGFMLFVGAWRCFYYPQYTRDGNSGPEPIAAYAIREHTLINSVFSTNLESTNNQYKSPFLTDLQIIYQYAGFPFGSMWLPLLVLCFYIFLYHALSEKLHPLISGLLLVFFIFTPEAYAYTFLCLFDYTNMALLFLGFYFLFRFFRTRQLNEFYFSALLMSFSVYVRSETLLLIAMATPMMLYSAYRSKEKAGKVLLHIAAFMLICTIAYFLPVQLYNNYYLPKGLAVDSMLNKNITNLSPFFNRLSDMTSILMFGPQGKILWGYFLLIFMIFLVAELIFKRNLDKEARNWLIAILIIYTGLALLGFLFPLITLQDTTKRGLFKLLPLMLLFVANTRLLAKLSERIRKWEGIV